jgi:hypothetical protein
LDKYGPAVGVGFSGEAFTLKAIQFNRVICMSQKNSKKPLTFTARLVNSHHGFQDFDIDGHPVVRRACVPNSIKKGEHFNVYHGESSKSGAVWTGTLGDSLRKFALI